MPVADYNTFLLELCVWREARGEPQNAKVAVAAVVLNRALDPKDRWPKTVDGVILQPYQFSSFNRNDPNATLFPSKRNAVDWEAYTECCLAVAAAQSGTDPTNGANHYWDTSIDTPGWAAGKIPVDIGRLRFVKI